MSSASVIKLEEKKRIEYANLKSFLNSIHLTQKTIYTSESPDFVIEDFQKNFTAIELTEYFKDYKNKKGGSKGKEVSNLRKRFSLDLNNYLNEYHKEKNLWILVQIDDTYVDYNIQDAIRAIENLLKTGEHRTTSNITKYLLGIQLNKTGNHTTSCCFVKYITGNETPPQFCYESIIALIEKKTESKKRWKNTFDSNWLIIHLGDIPEQYTIELELELTSEDVIRYSNEWNRIYIFCPSRNKSIRLF